MEFLESKLSILAIEDNPGDLLLLEEILNDEKVFPLGLVHLESFNSFSKGLKRLGEKKFDIILLDLSLQDSDSAQTLKKLEELEIDVPIIVLSGLNDLTVTKKALNRGAQDYLIKGTFSASVLLKTIVFSIERKFLVEKIELFNRELEEKVEEKTTELNQALKQMTSLMYETVSAMAKMVEMRDPYTAGHQERVTELALLIGEELKLPETSMTGLKYAGLLHDIGKIQVPAEILNKPGLLTDTEYQLIKNHAAAGFGILKRINFQAPVAEIVHQHHEKVDGTGYPRGLKFEDILLESRIIAVADTVEAVASHRPYRPALGIGKAIEIINEGKGSHYDPEVVEACKKVILEKRFEFSSTEH